MATIVPEFDQQARALDESYRLARNPAGQVRPSRAEIQEARTAYHLARNTLSLHFAEALAQEFAADLPAAIQARIFEKAWADGHSAGYHEVEYHYQELATFTTDVWNIARQD